MRSRRFVKHVLIALTWIVLLASNASAQSAIAGVVKDTTGAVLPGVTIEASSPALIERTRAVVSDAQGQYKIVDLRPGTYTVTFTLTGFNTVRRDGIELPANFTAPVSAEMKVGALEETITVSAESPVVDVQNAVQQQVLPQTLLDAVPTGGRNIQSIGAMLTGITQSQPDVGGAQGMQQTYMATHGADPRDNSIQVDGMSLNGIEGDGAIQQYYNEGMMAEMSYQTGGVSAETSGAGVRLNMIPKDGGNLFKGDVFVSGTNRKYQADNLTADLVNRGLKAGDSMDSIHDVNLGLGGPVMRNRLWFFSSFRHWGVNQNVANSFYNLDPTFSTYQPDPSRQVIDDNRIKSGVVRLTWQAHEKFKVASYLDRIIKLRGHENNVVNGGSQGPRTEETFGQRLPKIYYTSQAKITGTVTSRLLLEVGYSINNESYTTGEMEPSAAAGPNPIPRYDRVLQTYWGAVPIPYFYHEPVRRTFVSSLSYVTGSHAVKTGVQWGHGWNRTQQQFLQRGPDPTYGIDLVQIYANGQPDSVRVYNTPIHAREDLNADLGLYAQDNWTIRRLTLTPGVRFEHFNASIEAAAVGPGRFQPARQFPEVPDMPNWNDVAPRFGVAFDLFGNAKTALKGSVGRYMVAYSTVGFAQVYDPMFLSTDTRTWTDANKDGIAQDSELGPSQNSSFGIAPARRPDPNIKRPYSMEYSVSVQRELARGASVTIGYFRRDYHRLLWSHNVLAEPSDYTPLTTTNPLDGTPLTVYSLNRAKLGQVNIVDENSDTNTRVYNGIEGTFTARVAEGRLFGGFSTGRQISNNCQVFVSPALPSTTALTVASNPNTFRFCDQSQYDISFRAQFKLAGSYPLPLGFQASGSFQSYPGAVANGSNATSVPWLNVNYVVNSRIVPGLVQSQETIPLIAPGSKYLDRWNQLDLRLAKKFKMRRGEWQVQADLFNSLNSNVVLNQNQTFGASLDQPTQILQGRLLTLGAQLHF